jgi:hypothetical protein
VVYLFYVKDFGAGASLRFPEEFKETVRGKDLCYQVKAVIHHEGPNRHSGHFKTFVKSDNKVWYCLDDEAVRMVTWEAVSKCRPYALFYQKQGDPAAAREFQQSQLSLRQKQDRIKSTVDDNETGRREKEERLRNPMVELFLEAAPQEPKEPSSLRKRFRPIRDPLSQLRKLKALVSLRPNLAQLGPQTQKISAQALRELDRPDRLAWDSSKGAAVADLESAHSFMLGRIQRQRDQYDVEYDQGKVKKLKKKKHQQKINFDKQAKRLSKHRTVAGR